MNIFTNQHIYSLAFNPSPKALDFYNATNHARQLMWLGGQRSLKTSSVVNLCAMHATGEYPDWFKGYRYSRPTTGMIGTVKAGKTRDVLQRYLLEGDRLRGMVPFIHPDSIQNKISGGIAGGLDWLHVKHVSGGISKIKFISFAEGASNLQSDTFDYALLDESAKFDVYQEALRRTMAMDKEKTFVYLTLWPEHGRDEVVDFFMQKGSAGEFIDGHYYQHSSWSNNPFLTEEEKTRQRQGIPAYMLEAAEHGIPIFGVGKVFHFSEEDIVVKAFPIPDNFPIYFGIDPATKHGGHWGVSVFAYDPYKQALYMINDYKMSNIRWLEHYDNISRIIPKKAKGVCDPAGNGEDSVTLESTFDFLKKKFSKDGILLNKAKKGDFSKEVTIGKIHTMVASQKFFVFDNCKQYLEEFRKYARDEKERIIKEDDHIIDACNYVVHYVDNMSEHEKTHSLYAKRKRIASGGHMNLYGG